MITLYILQKLYSLVDAFTTQYFDPFIDLLDTIAPSIGALRVPVLVSDMFRVSALFLPMSTVAALLGFTILLLLIQTLHSFARWLVHLFGLL